MFNAGNLNTLQVDKVIAVVDCSKYAMPAPVKRDLWRAQDENRHIDLTNNKKTLAVLYLTDGYIATSGVSGPTLTKRIEETKRLRGI